MEKPLRLIRFQKDAYKILERKIGIIYMIITNQSLQRNNLNGHRKCGIGEMETGNIMLLQESVKSSAGSLHLAVW